MKIFTFTLCGRREEVRAHLRRVLQSAVKDYSSSYRSPVACCSEELDPTSTFSVVGLSTVSRLERSSNTSYSRCFVLFYSGLSHSISSLPPHFLVKGEQNVCANDVTGAR